MVDPDHPLAALVRKAQTDSPAPTPPTADGGAVQPSQVEYTTDCEYLAVCEYLTVHPPACSKLQGLTSRLSRGGEAGSVGLVEVP